MRLSLFRYIANLKIASAQIACRDGLLIECIANQKFANSRKTRYLILAIKTRPAVIPFEFLFIIHGENAMQQHSCYSTGKVGPDTAISDRCVIGAACEINCRGTLSPDTVVYGSDCHQYTKKSHSQVLPQSSECCIMIEMSMCRNIADNTTMRRHS